MHRHPRGALLLFVAFKGVSTTWLLRHTPVLGGSSEGVSVPQLSSDV
jgi:hypothetical protein